MRNNLSNIYKFCRDNIEEIENFHEAISDRSEVYDCHHRLETHDESGKLRDTLISREELISKGLYYNRPASELIFLKKSEHSKLHRQFSNIDGHRYLNGDNRRAERARNHRLDEDNYSKQLESNKKYQDKHKEEIRTYQKEYQDKHKEEIRAYHAKYWAEHGHKQRIIKKVKCIETGIVYNSTKELANEFDYNYKSLSRYISANKKYKNYTYVYI